MHARQTLQQSLFGLFGGNPQLQSVRCYGFWRNFQYGSPCTLQRIGGPGDMQVSMRLYGNSCSGKNRLKRTLDGFTQGQRSQLRVEQMPSIFYRRSMLRKLGMDMIGKMFHIFVCCAGEVISETSSLKYLLHEAHSTPVLPGAKPLRRPFILGFP